MMNYGTIKVESFNFHTSAVEYAAEKHGPRTFSVLEQLCFRRLLSSAIEGQSYDSLK